MKVSFITVGYKTPGLLRQLFTGIENAKFSFPFEYLFVNNASGDGTSEMIREQFPWVTVIDAPGNLGFGRSNNLASLQARGEYLMLLNPDITVFKGEMEKLLAFADTHPEAGMIGPKLLNPDRTVQHWYYRFPSPLVPIYRRTALGKTAWGKRTLAQYFMNDSDPNVTQEVDGFFGSAMLVRRGVYQQLGGFDERFFMYFEDIDLCRRMWEQGWRVRYAPSSVFVHYHQRQSYVRNPLRLIANPLVREHIKSGVWYFWKHRGKLNPRDEVSKTEVGMV
ncbi:MAG: glycosyltransferase family 2 protein [bacterium]|nr:glycosyltransferase family 2 protein [bacterium]